MEYSTIRNNKEWTTDAHKNGDKPYNNYAYGKKPTPPNGWALYGFIYMNRKCKIISKMSESRSYYCACFCFYICFLSHRILLDLLQSECVPVGGTEVTWWQAAQGWLLVLQRPSEPESLVVWEALPSVPAQSRQSSHGWSSFHNSQGLVMGME